MHIVSRRAFLVQQVPALASLCVLPAVLNCSSEPETVLEPLPTYDRHATTEWDLRPSVVFDTLCFLNALSGDPFYLTYYQADYARFNPQLSSAARAALASLKQKLKDENGNIVSAFLCLHLSGGTAQTVAALISSLDNLAPLQSALQQTVYYTSDSWKLFTTVVPLLRTVLVNLQALGFEQYWEANILPALQAHVTSTATQISSYNVVAEDEAMLGMGLSSNRITLYLLNYNNPHGMRLAGTRFIANAFWPLNTLVINAAHELLHPPYDIERDATIRTAINSMANDSFVMNKVQHHDVSFGYNSLTSYMEEDCVRALDQLATERMGLASDPRARWQLEDGGMHVFAAALYAFLKSENHPARGERFRDVLLRGIQPGGALAPGEVEAKYNAFYAG